MMSKTVWIILIVCLCLALCICAGLFLAGRIASSFTDSQTNTDTNKYKDLKNPYSEDGSYSVKANDLKELTIDWISGSVTIVLTDGDVIRIQETADKTIKERDALRYGISADKLRIQACRKNHPGRLPRKDLVVSLPRSLAAQLRECEIDTVSASVSAAGLHLDELEVNTVSGKVELSNMIAEGAGIDTVSGPVILLDSQVSSLRMDSVSGMMKVSGSVKKIKVSSVSGPLECNADACNDIRANTLSGTVDFILDKTPDKMSVDTSSGDIRIALPTDTSCSIQMDTMSGKLYLNGEAVGAKQLTLGEGEAQFDIDSMSGSVFIRTKEPGFTLFHLTNPSQSATIVCNKQGGYPHGKTRKDHLGHPLRHRSHADGALQRRARSPARDHERPGVSGRCKHNQRNDL